jgi:hypothetical protein
MTLCIHVPQGHGFSFVTSYHAKGQGGGQVIFSLWDTENSKKGGRREHNAFGGYKL